MEKRWKEALDMRLLGMTYPAIAKYYGFSQPAAHQMVKRAMKHFKVGKYADEA